MLELYCDCRTVPSHLDSLKGNRMQNLYFILQIKMPDGLKFYDSLKDQQSLPWTLEQSYLSDKYNLYSLNLPPPLAPPAPHETNWTSTFTL